MQGSFDGGGMLQLTGGMVRSTRNMSQTLSKIAGKGLAPLLPLLKLGDEPRPR